MKNYNISWINQRKSRGTVRNVKFIDRVLFFFFFYGVVAYIYTYVCANYMYIYIYVMRENLIFYRHNSRITMALYKIVITTSNRYYLWFTVRVHWCTIEKSTTYILLYNEIKTAVCAWSFFNYRSHRLR